MTLDPRWSIGLSLFLAVLGYVGGASGTFVDMGFDPMTVKHALAGTSFALGIGNTINAVLTGIPSKNNTTGFLVKGPPAP